MKIKVSKVMKVKASYSSQRETVVTSSFRACSLAMDDGGRCLLDVINDPKLLQSFLESGSDENSKDFPDGTSSESAVESPQVPRNSQAAHASNISSADNLIDQTEMGYSYVTDNQALLSQSGVYSTSTGLGGTSFILTPTSVGSQTYQHASSSGATIHHHPSTNNNVNFHPHSPASARSVTPSHNIKSPNVGPSSVNSMPPPSPLQQTKSPMPSHTPSPVPSWSPVAPVSPAASRNQPSMPSVAFQQTQNQILQTSCNPTQYVTAFTTPQSVTQKLTVQQQQQQIYLQQQIPPASQQQTTPRLTTVPTPVVTTAAVGVQQPVVQLISAQPSNVVQPTSRTSHSNVRPIQPKLPPQILPKPATSSASNQYVSPASTPKQTQTIPATTGQRTLGIQSGAAPLVINQAQPGMYSGPGTILLNPIIPGVSNQILIQSNLSNLTNLSSLFALRPSNNPSGQTLNSSTTQNNALIAALQNPNQQAIFASAKQPIHGQQTIMIPNNIAHTGLAPQNINLTSAAIPNSGIISSSSQGQNFLRGSNIILAPNRVMGANQGLQLQPIQTASGAVYAFAGQTITVPGLPTALSNTQLAPVTVPMHGVMTSQGMISGLSLQPQAPQSALQPQQSLFGTAVPFSNHVEQPSQVIQVPQPLAAPQQVATNHQSHLQNQPQQIEHSPASSPQKPKVPTLNLEKLMKESGIVPSPESQIIQSPDCNSPVVEEPIQSHLDMNSSQLITALQSSQQVILEQSPGHTVIPQLKLAFGDGSVILHQPATLNNNSRLQHYISSGQIHGRTVNTTVGSIVLTSSASTSVVSVPVVTTESTSQNHSTLISRLNAAPVISVPDASTLAVTTNIVTSTTNVPLTVQSLNDGNPSSYVVQRTNTLTSTSDRVFVSETVLATQTHTTPVISTSSSIQNVQRINHSNPALQTIIVSNEHNVRTVPQSSHTVLVSTLSSQNAQPVLQKYGQQDLKIQEIIDSGAVVPNHNHPHSSHVPNTVSNLLEKIQKEITELNFVKNRTPEQNKIFQLLQQLKQKVMQSNKSKGNRNQNQRLENEANRIVQMAQASHSASSESSQQLTLKNPALTVQQQSGQLDKSQHTNSKPLASRSLQLVNLLKQSPSHIAPTKHITHAPTIVTAVCDSTTTTVESSSTAHQKPNQAIAPSQPRLQTSHNQTKTSNEVTQIIVRLQKPVQQQSVIQPPPNVIQRKAPSPVKRVVNTALICEQLKNDQNGAVNPNVKTPFSSTIDACCRLLKYHVYNTTDSSPSELAEAETAFQSTSVSHMDKIKSLKDRFNFAQMKSTMKPVPTSEEIYIQRLLIDEEQEALNEDKVAVAEGRELSLPLARQQWLYKVLHSPTPERPTSPDFEIQEEKKTCGDSCRCRDDYDPPNAEYSDPVYKDDDNLEAPVIDSCADIVVPQHNDNCDRSPPTLKRIVTKPIKFTESDPEDQIPARKRVKFNNNTVFKNEVSVLSHDKPILSKYNDNLPKTNHKYPMTFQSESSLSDVVSDAELRKEFSMSPMEMDEAHIDSRLVNLDSSSEVNHLVDFEPLIPGTGESCDSNTLYNNSLRNNCVDYMLNEDWPNEFAHQPTELDIAVANIERNHNNPADIDFSGLDGLDAHFNNSQHCIPNGIQDDDTSAEMNLIGYRIPKQQKRYHDSSVQSVSNCSDMGDQTHSAIKSIIDPESRYDRISTEFMSLNRHNQNAHIGGYSSSASARNMGSTSMKKEDRNLDEAVRSILI